MISNICYHDIGEDKLSVQHKGGLVSVSWDKILSAHGAATT